MRKALLIFILTTVMVCNTVFASSMNVQAQDLSNSGFAIAESEAISFLLSLIGVKVSEVVKDGTASFTAMLNNMRNNKPELAAWYWATITHLVAGRKGITISRHILEEYKEWASDYFGTTAGTSTNVGTVTTDLMTMDAVSMTFDTSYAGIQGTFQITGLPSDGYYMFYGIRYRQSYNPNAVNSLFPGFYRFIFLPAQLENMEGYWDNVQVSSTYNNSHITKGTYETITVNGKTMQVLQVIIGDTFSAYNGGSDLDLLVPHDSYFVGSTYGTTSNRGAPYLSDLQNNIIALINNQGITENITGTVMEGVTDAGTSVDETIVGPGTVVSEQDGEVVIGDEDIYVNLSDVSIDALLQGIRDGVIDYPALVDALGLALVNTRAETVAEIADAVTQVKQKELFADVSTGPYTVALDKLFPFCIPFDLFALIQMFNAIPEAPEVTISLPTGYDGSQFTWTDYTISLSPFDQVAQVVRIFEYILFVIGLMMVTRKLIEG